MLVYSQMALFAMEPQEAEETPKQLDSSLVIKDVSLVDLTMHAVAQLAYDRYLTEGFEGLERYLAALPQEMKFDLVFCSMINDFNHGNIFVHELKMRYKRDKEEAIAFFNLFCAEARYKILEYCLLFEELSLEDRAFISSLIDSIKIPNELSVIATFIDSIIESANEGKKNYLKELENTLTKQLQEIITTINAKELISQFDSKIVAQANHLLEVFQQDENGVINFTTALNSLEVEMQQNVLRYLVMGFALQNKENCALIVDLISNLAAYGQLRIAVLKGLYSEFITTYPSAKDLLRTYAEKIDLRTSLLSTLQGCLETTVSYLVKILIQDESRVREALELLKDISPETFAEVAFLLTQLDQTDEEASEAHILAIFEKALYITFLAIIERDDLDEDNIQHILECITEGYATLKVNKKFLAIAIEQIKKLKESDKTQKLLQDIQEYCWLNVHMENKTE